MTYPKHYAKGASRKVSHNVRDDVKLTFAGYTLVAEVKPEESKLDVAELNQPPLPTAELNEQPQLPLADLVKHPEGKDAEVVDVSTGAPKPSAPKKN